MDEAKFRCELEALISEREGCIAENKWRERRGEAVAYGESHFFELANRFKALYQEFKNGK